MTSEGMTHDTIVTGELRSSREFWEDHSLVCDAAEPNPHLRRPARTTQRIMADVLLALTPAVFGSIYFFGPGVLLYYVAAVLSGLGTSIVIQIMQKRQVYTDLSAAVTGLLFAMSMPSTMPLWFVVVGPMLGLVVAKEAFGGIGRIFLNPALTARAVFRLIFANQVLQNPWPSPPFASLAPDAVASATPLAAIKAGASPTGMELWDSFIGNVGGKMGETSALLLLLGAVYLVARGVIRLRIPGAALLAMACMAWAFGGAGGLFSATPAMVVGHLLGGATVLGLFYMATDYGSSPTDPRAQYIYGALLGVVIMLWRLLSPWAEGFTFALLTMNLTVPLFNRFMRPRVVGETRADKRKAQAL